MVLSIMSNYINYFSCIPDVHTLFSIYAADTYPRLSIIQTTGCQLVTDASNTRLMNLQITSQMSAPPPETMGEGGGGPVL
jgi:hypothetical protein